MILREPCLRPGWYPLHDGSIEGFLKPFLDDRKARETSLQKALSKEDFCCAAISPHAGWFYSGVPAAKAVSSLDPQVETVVVIGGHLAGRMPVLAAIEDGVKTPLGVLEIDTELREKFGKLIPFEPDIYEDNTIEVLLPMVHFFFPGVKILWLRFPAAHSSFEAGKSLAKSAKTLGRKIAVLASTDLTHYGKNYGFSPKGMGKKALEWMEKVNDAAFIDAVLKGDPELVLKRAEEDSSACSAGAVLGALGFAKSSGKNHGRLLDYRTSAETAEDELPVSFVGYAAISLG